MPNNGSIRFYNVPWTSEMRHVTDESFKIAPALTLTGYAYQPKDGVFRLKCNVGDIDRYNYISWINPDDEAETLYAFIEDINYIAPMTTDVRVTMDYWTTYNKSITLLPTFVEREHVANDIPGEHTVPEGLETGDMVNHEEIRITNTPWPGLVMAVTSVPYLKGTNTRVYNDPKETAPLVGSTLATGQLMEIWGQEPDPSYTDMVSALHEIEFRPVKAGTYGGVYTGAQLLTWNLSNQAGIDAAGNFIKLYVRYGQEDQIISMWSADLNLLGYSYDMSSRPDLTKNPQTLNDTSNISGWAAPSEGNMRPSNIDGFIPANNKLFSYPYVEGRVHNGNGSSMTLKSSDFLGGIAKFMILSDFFSPSPQVKLQLLNRVGDYSNNDEVMTLSGYPMVNWTTDVYASWLGSNRSSMTATGISAGVKMIAGVAAAGVTGGSSLAMSTVSAVDEVYNKVAEHEDKSRQGSQFHGSLSTSLNFMDKTIGFYFQLRTITAEYAKIIDDYFTMYGYKVNSVKVPNLKSRPHFNYVKTVGCNLTGNVPEVAKREIRAMFDRGVTIWHNSNTMYRYLMPNQVG